MRLWTLHPKYLDPQGLVALWREALRARSPSLYRIHRRIEAPAAHPLFRLRRGPVAEWERP